MDTSARQPDKPKIFLIKSGLFLNEDIRRAKRLAKRSLAAYPRDGYYPGDGDYPKENIFFKAETIYLPNNPRSKIAIIPEADDTKLADATTFVLGGLHHDNAQDIEKLIANLHKLLPKETVKSFDDSALIFCPSSDRANRIDEAYEWNHAKNFPYGGAALSSDPLHPALTDDVKDFANRLWAQRFVDNKNKLIPSDKFKGFNFVTYSIGGRLSFIVENILRMKLREALSTREDTPRMSPAEQDAVIQKYFSKCRNFSIGHAVDWEDFPARQPSIPKEYVIGKDDLTVIYRDSFWDFMQKQDFLGHSAIAYDLQTQFKNGEENYHHVTILDDHILAEKTPSQPASSESIDVHPNLHGLGLYMKVLTSRYKESPEIAEFVDRFNVAVTPKLASTSSLDRAPDTRSGGSRTATP